MQFRPWTKSRLDMFFFVGQEKIWPHFALVEYKFALKKALASVAGDNLIHLLERCNKSIANIPGPECRRFKAHRQRLKSIVGNKRRHAIRQVQKKRKKCPGK